MTKHVDEQLEAAPPSAPRFEEKIEVEGRTPETMLERYLKAQRLDCGPTGSGTGAPTELEMRAVRPHPSPYVDFLPLINLVRDALKKRKPDRFFVYRATRSGVVTYTVRADLMPASMLYAVPGTLFELVEGFRDLDDATRALRRLERGFDTAVPKTKASPPPPWMTAQPCTPP